MTRRLIRESDPPAGQLASPVPQYWNPNTEAFEDVLGAHGAPRAILYGPNGQPISQSNPLEVRVRELEAELAAMRGMLETGDAKVQLKGSDVEPINVQLSGTTIVLDAGVTELFYQGSHSVVVDTSNVSRVVVEVASEMYTNVLVEGKAANGEWAPVAPSHEVWKSYVLSIPCMFDSMRLTITNVGRKRSQLFWTIGGYLV